LSRGKISWKPYEKIEDSSSKPTLVALVENCGYASDKMRLGLFESADADKLINENPVPPAVQDGFTSLNHSTLFLNRTLLMR